MRDGSMPVSSHGLNLAGDTLYVGAVHYQSFNGHLHSGVVVALDRRDGHELWRYETTADPHHDVSSAPLVIGNLLVLDDLIRHGLYAIDRFHPAAGEQWRMSAPSNAAGPTTPSVQRRAI